MKLKELLIIISVVLFTTCTGDNPTGDNPIDEEKDTLTESDIQEENGVKVKFISADHGGNDETANFKDQTKVFKTTYSAELKLKYEILATTNYTWSKAGKYKGKKYEKGSEAKPTTYNQIQNLKNYKTDTFKIKSNDGAREYNSDLKSIDMQIDNSGILTITMEFQDHHTFDSKEVVLGLSIELKSGKILLPYQKLREKVELNVSKL